jgi:hypothetical protein
MESAAASWIPLLIAPFAEMGNGDSLRSGYTQRDNDGGIANSILRALCNSFAFFWSRICWPL